MSEPIAAIATPPVPSAIGIVRVSGEGAIEAASAVFRAASGRPLAACESRRLVYGTLLGPDGAPIDQVLATVSRAPHSYTGEDTAELQCHGSPAVLAMALESLFAQGVRQAGPGEFTKRAFLNGKLDLTQAEAVADLLEAETPAAVRQAAGQLSGALSRRVAALYDGLVDLMAHFHAVLDYPDEDIDPFRADTIRAGLDTARTGLEALLRTYDRGRYIAGGVPCVLIGRPNAGKSSLLNALVGYDRAIVTDVPGTTRDTVEARCRVGGVVLRLIDTAGLRETDDAVERIGVERSRAALEEAALALLVLDGSASLTPEDEAAMAQAARAPRVICLINKSDRPLAFAPEELRSRFPHLCVVSAATGAGLDALGETVAALFPAGGAESAGELLTNARQADAARRALEAVTRASESLEAGITPDALLTDAEEALAALGELTGASVREDVTARIFERFCVGKKDAWPAARRGILSGERSDAHGGLHRAQRLYQLRAVCLHLPRRVPDRGGRVGGGLPPAWPGAPARCEIRRRGLPGQHHLSGGVTGQARQVAAAIGSGHLRFLRLSRLTPSATAHCSPLRKKHLAPSAQLP